MTYTERGKPVVDLYGRTTDENSCYQSTKTEIENSDNKFILGVDHLVTQFQHAILVVQSFDPFEASA